MNKKIILHIGTNKTGTSSLQSFLANNPTFLNRHGFIYPKFGQIYCGHHEIAHGLSNERVHGVKMKPKSGQDFLNKINNLYKDHPDHTVILSSEAFYANNKPLNIAKYLDGFDVKIICYFREYISYISSWYQQYVSDSNFFGNINNYFDKIKDYTEYQGFANQWVNVFSSNNFIAKSFDRTSLYKKDIIHDFFKILGVDKINFNQKLYSNNYSLSGNLLYIKKLLNQYITFEQAVKSRDQIACLSEYYEEWYPLFSKPRPKQISFQGKLNMMGCHRDYIYNYYKDSLPLFNEKYNLNLKMAEKISGPKAPNMDFIEEDFKLVLKECNRSQPKLFELLSNIDLHKAIEDLNSKL